MFRRIQGESPVTQTAEVATKKHQSIAFCPACAEKGIINKIVPTTINRKSLRQLFEQVKYTTFF